MLYLKANMEDLCIPVHNTGCDAELTQWQLTSNFEVKVAGYALSSTDVSV